MGCNQLSITSLKLGHGRLIASNIKLWVWYVFRAGTLVRTCPHIAKFMGPTWGPPGSCRPQVGPMLAQWTLLSGHDYRTLLVKALEFGRQKHVTHAVQLSITALHMIQRADAHWYHTIQETTVRLSRISIKCKFPLQYWNGNVLNGFEEIFYNGYAGNHHFDAFQCSQWRNFVNYISVLMAPTGTAVLLLIDEEPRDFGG